MHLVAGQDGKVRVPPRFPRSRADLNRTRLSGFPRVELDQIVMSKSPPGPVEGESAGLGIGQHLFQLVQALLQGTRWRGSKRADCAHSAEDLDEFGVPKLERRRCQEEHPTEDPMEGPRISSTGSFPEQIAD